MKHPTLKGFSWYVEERERIRMNKEAKLPHPLTKDPILQKYRFCNVYREDDAVSQWMKANIWNKKVVDSGYTDSYDQQELHADILSNCIFHRAHSNIDTCRDVGFVTYGQGADYIMKKWLERKKAGKAWGTWSFHTTPMRSRWQNMAEYLFPQGDGAAGARADEWMCDIFPQHNKTKLEHVTKALQDVPSIGKFLSWQITADLTQTGLLDKAPDLHTYADPGPGAREGLRQLNLPPTLDGIHEVMKQHNEVSTVKLDTKDTQHNLCEYAKYDYTFHGRSHPKLRYRGAEREHARDS